MNDIPKVMIGIQLTGHGGLDKLVQRGDIPIPTPGTRDVLIKVSAAGVNNTDINTRTAWYSKSDGNSDAARSGCASVCYTYVEPTIFYEFAYDCSVLAHERRLNTRRRRGEYLLPRLWH